MPRIILRGGALLAPQGLIRNAGVIVEDGRILSVGPNDTLSPAPGDETLDLPDRLIAPGFVNGHTHMYGLLAHGIDAEPPAGGFSSFLEDFWWPRVENRIDIPLARATAQWSMAELIDSGVTSFVDVLEAPFALPGALEAIREVVESAGMRAVLCFEACQRAGERIAAQGLAENAAFVRAHNASSGLVRGMMCIHTLFTCDPGYITQARRLADELDCDIHMHLSESAFEPDWSIRRYKKRPVHVYDSFGFLDARTLASQCVQLDESEMDVLAARGVRAVHMPLSNCEVGGGVAPITQLLARGMRVGLGSDGYINNFFEIMRGAFLIPKAHWQDVSRMPARTVYELATRLGAQAAGLYDTGRLERGCLADLITLGLDTPTPVTAHNVYDQLVLYRNPEHVYDVMIGGRFVKRERRLLTVDAEQARRTLYACASRFWQNEQEDT